MDHTPAEALAAEETVGDALARTLAEMGVEVAFGVISIHNMPILDAVARAGRIRFVPARGEAGAMNMADAHARVSRSLGVCLTSTGTAAGNAAGSQVEALTAGSPVLHVTTQVDRAFMDRDRAAIHDVPRQPEMLRAVSKAYVRAWEPEGAAAALRAAARLALSAPSGPVSYEIPVDVQRARVRIRPGLGGPVRPAGPAPDKAALDALAERLLRARRPMLWLGGGARGASEAATALVGRGFAAVTSTNGRAVVPEGHPRSLGAYTMTPDAQAVYGASDLMLVVGSRLRGNETRNNAMPLPPLAQADADPTQAGRNYPVELFVAGDARLVLEGLLRRLPERLETEADFLDMVGPARARSEAALLRALGPYAEVARALGERVRGRGLPWVRDVTIANSTFGNRFVPLAAPHLGVHAVGGGIGQGIAMGIGAALAGEGRAVALVGDGGAQLMIGELATAVEARAGVVLVLMNDRGYGVIRNIQDAQYGGRRAYADILTPDFGKLCEAVGLPHERVSRVADFAPALDRALDAEGPRMVEVDMDAIGPFAESFAGPPAGAAGSAR